MAAHPVETYLKDLDEIYRTGGGVAEESYYGPLEALFNEIGKKLKPRVRCVAQLRNTGAGEPDFGLYTSNQFQRAGDAHPMEGQPPERGVIECKPWNDDSFARSEGVQVSKYWKKYGLVLVTNYRDFVLIGRDDRDKPIRLESFRLAESENAFRGMLAQPHKAAQQHGERLVECLRRTMLHAAPLTDPQDLAWFLASYAREARARVAQTAELPALEGLKKGIEEALGMKFEGEKGQHFFLATLVQTLFYGVFSSWVLWCRENWSRPEARFQWHDAAWTLHVPMIASLFDQIATPQRLKPLGIDEVLDKAALVLNRVDRPAFFSKFEQEHAVQYFYEPFLEAYDPELRKDLGVWYTPPEVVQYQVERVDQALREELHIPDGLADERVVVLDPCCGTGAYLVETLRRIHKTLQEKGRSALTAQNLKKAASTRVFGFEILPAPFVISHLQIGLMLRLLGAPFNIESDERARVYLTNALTGWEPPKEPKKQLRLFPEMMQERDAADKVKQDTPILVILGNPPYNGFAGMAVEEERDLVTAYRNTKRAPKPEGQGLNDLYVRFFRMAERRIVEKTGKGVICFISNYSWLEGLSHTGMRERYLDAFDHICIDCLNGDKYKTGKLTPWGDPDPSIFSTESNREGIQVGTAITTLVLSESHGNAGEPDSCSIAFRHLWGKAKHAELLRNARGEEQIAYLDIRPEASIGYPFAPMRMNDSFRTWPSLPDLFPFSCPGVKTSRDLFLVDIDRNKLEERLRTYFDRSVSNEEIARQYPEVMIDSGGYDARIVRSQVLSRGVLSDFIVPYQYRPLDTVWLYWEPKGQLLDRKREELFHCIATGNTFLVARPKGERQQEGFPIYLTSAIADWHLTRPGSILFPLSVRNKDANQARMFAEDQDWSANLSTGAQNYLDWVGLPVHRCEGQRTSEVSSENDGMQCIWFHAVAVGYSPSYLDESSDAIRQDWPRIPLPKTKKAFLASAALGRRIAALLDTEKPVDGVTAGKIDPRLKEVGVVSRVGPGGLNPDEGHLDLTAGWGHTGKGGVCMPGTGRHETRAQREESLKAAFGDQTLDVYLNETAYWSNVPKCVWEYHIGGYQVIKKWLSYREKAILGRGLRVEEAEYVTEMVRRIAALILMQPELDASYEAVKADTWPWPHEKHEAK